MEFSSSSTSRNLILHVQQGDAEAWRRFTSIYVPLIQYWVRSTGLQAADTLDVTQNVFVGVIRGLPRFQLDGEGNSLRAWLRTITRNAVVEWHRSHQRGAQPLPDDHPLWDNAAAARSTGEQSPGEQSSGEPGAAADERNLLVAQATEIIRAEFRPDTWNLFWRAAVDGLPFDLVAADHGVTPWAVYKAKARILARFRELIGDFLSDLSNPNRS